MKINVNKSVMEKNEYWANKNRKLFKTNNVTVLNVIGSPGSGKTSLLYKTLMELKQLVTFGVIEGDVECDYDKLKIEETGAVVELINTHSSCHLNSEQIYEVVKEMPLLDIDILFIENIGNLICPVSYDLGEEKKIAVLSTAEGEEKPEKYPALFVKSNIVLLTKTDLIPHLDYSINDAIAGIQKVNLNSTILPLSSKTGEGFKEWLDYLVSISA